MAGGIKLVLSIKWHPELQVWVPVSLSGNACCILALELHLIKVMPSDLAPFGILPFYSEPKVQIQ